MSSSSKPVPGRGLQCLIPLLQRLCQPRQAAADSHCFVQSVTYEFPADTAATGAIQPVSISDADSRDSRQSLYISRRAAGALVPSPWRLTGERRPGSGGSRDGRDGRDCRHRRAPLIFSRRGPYPLPTRPRALVYGRTRCYYPRPNCQRQPRAGGFCTTRQPHRTGTEHARPPLYSTLTRPPRTRAQRRDWHGCRSGGD